MKNTRLAFSLSRMIIQLKLLLIQHISFSQCKHSIYAFNPSYTLFKYIFDPLPVCNPFIIRNNWLHSGCIFWQPADFSANSEGVIQPSAEWVRLRLQCMRQASILHRASSRTSSHAGIPAATCR